MRENRPYGSEGGDSESFPDPYSSEQVRFALLPGSLPTQG
jgi:hypothetical protein